MEKRGYAVTRIADFPRNDHPPEEIRRYPQRSAKPASHTDKSDAEIAAVVRFHSRSIFNVREAFPLSGDMSREKAEPRNKSGQHHPHRGRERPEQGFNRAELSVSRRMK